VSKKRTAVYDRIRELREKKEPDRERFAKKLGITPIRLWRLETGRTKLTASEVPKFARALEVTVAELYGEAA
jgi:transcriptional regulator with XRE-family HTH domain